MTPIRHYLASFFIAAPALLLPGTPAQAEDGGGENPVTASEDDSIVVTAHALRELGLLAGNIEIEGDELLRESSPQIGDILAKLPGVSTTSFAPGASRPVLRGFSGDRVLVLVDGLGSLDASSISADHGVALDTLTIDHIDVLHGPALLAYGGQAIGGAVIAHDKRIPRSMPEGVVDGTLLAGFSSVSDGKSAAASIDLPLAATIVLHADVSWNDANNERVGGSIVTQRLRRELIAKAANLREAGDSDRADALESDALSRGRIANSFARGSSFGVGIAWLGDDASLGVSIQRLDNRYGIPARPGSDEVGASIDMHQTRFDLRGALDTGSFIDRIELRAAYADYGHAEIEADGEVGTLFAREGFEGRLEFIQAERSGWRGRSGVQYSWGRLGVTGEEAILPDHSSERIGVFTLQSLKLGQVEIQAAGRLERVTVNAPDAGFGKHFTLRSAAAGISWQPSSPFKLGASYTHGERAPSPEELLTNGAHIATQAFEIGDRTFTRERSDGVEAYLEYSTDRTTLNLTAYITRFADFITLDPDGTMQEGLPVFRYRQRPARFRGFEAQGRQELAQWGNRALTFEMSGDYVHATIKGLGPAPRIPPLRIQGGLELASPTLSLRAGVEWNAPQKRVPALEIPTKSFTLINIDATWRPFGEDGALTLVLAGENLFDALGRRAASFTRDFVPVAGRDIRVTARLSF